MCTRFCIFLNLINMKDSICQGRGGILLLCLGSTPNPVTVANEGLFRDSLLKM